MSKNWNYTYSKRVPNVDPSAVWKVWTDVDQWKTWQDDIESIKLMGPFKVGTKIAFKPKGGPTFHLDIVEVQDGKIFTDITHFLFAKMHDRHELIVHENEVEIKTTLSVDGPLSFFWRKLVIENIAKGIEVQTENLIAKVKALQ